MVANIYCTRAMRFAVSALGVKSTDSRRPATRRNMGTGMGKRIFHLEK
jgi:hypothetical protein